MTARVQVVPVKAAPTIQGMDMLSGIRTREAAQAWGQKHGYRVVFFWPQRERVYADKMAEVAERAAELETRSAALVDFAEGQA